MVRFRPISRVVGPLRNCHSMAYKRGDTSVLGAHPASRPTINLNFHEFSNIPLEHTKTTPKQELMKGFLSFRAERGCIGHTVGLCLGVFS